MKKKVIFLLEFTGIKVRDLRQRCLTLITAQLTSVKCAVLLCVTQVYGRVT